LLLSLPCLVAFLVVPDLIMRALFMRGAFTAADAAAAGATLTAYALGLLPFVLVRSVTATFLARGDTATPVKAAVAAVAVNVAFKIALMGPLAQVGLALATSIGAWINLVLVVYFARRQRLIAFDPALRRSLARLGVAALALTAVLWLARQPVAALVSELRALRDETALAALAALGIAVYGGTVLALFGRSRLAIFRGAAKS
jgi:putative peptidoglycan lipid II flippase